jgi:hypothetical protein
MRLIVFGFVLLFVILTVDSQGGRKFYESKSFFIRNEINQMRKWERNCDEI